jgi:hypothetical protein
MARNTTCCLQALAESACHGRKILTPIFAYLGEIENFRQRGAIRDGIKWY